MVGPGQLLRRLRESWAAAVGCGVVLVAIGALRGLAGGLLALGADVRAGALDATGRCVAVPLGMVEQLAPVALGRCAGLPGLLYLNRKTEQYLQIENIWVGVRDFD